MVLIDKTLDYSSIYGPLKNNVDGVYRLLLEEKWEEALACINEISFLSRAMRVSVIDYLERNSIDVKPRR